MKLTPALFLPQGKYMDIEFDFKGDPVGGLISNCKLANVILFCWSPQNLILVQ